MRALLNAAKNRYFTQWMHGAAVWGAVCLGLGSIFPVAHAASQVVSEDSTLSVRWSYTSAGNHCSGYPARRIELYSSLSAPSNICCDQPDDPNSCKEYGGWKTGTPNHGACEGQPTPGYFMIYIYKYGVPPTSPDYSSSSYNGSQYGYSTTVLGGSSISRISPAIGFTNHKPANCSDMGGSGICYTGHVYNLNFSTATENCGKWISTTISDCAFSSLKFDVKIEPNSGCPTSSPALPGLPGGPGASPSASPACNYDTGGLGRVCSSNSDCCSGLCATAGDQPFMTNRTCAVGDASCIIGPKFVSNYASPGGKDPYGAGGTKPSGGIAKISPAKVCVPSGTSATYADYVKPPSAVPVANLNKKLVLNDGSYLRCYLEADDVHRNADGCSCKTGYEGVVLSSSDYASYSLAMLRPRKLEVMWAQIEKLILSHPQQSRAIGNVLARAIPSAFACGHAESPGSYCCPSGKVIVCAGGHLQSSWGGGADHVQCVSYTAGSLPPCPCSCEDATSGGSSGGGLPLGGGGGTIADIYSDETSPTWRTSTPQNYGQGSGSDQSANDVISAGAGYKLACVKKCDGTTLGRDPAHPLQCLCPTNAVWDPVNYTCKTCYEGAILDSGGNCTCPQGYSPTSVSGGQACRPDLPSGEYTRDANGYPICGSGRVPMTYDLTASTFSSQTTPKTKNVATINGKTYSYASPAPTASPYPIYYYQNLPHCGCTTVADPSEFPVGTAPSNQFVSADDSASGIKQRGANGLPVANAYGMVSIALDGVDDGRQNTTPSKCGCPNVNEKPVIVGGKTVCQPKVDVTDPNMRFATFDPDHDDVSGVVLNDGDEVKVGGKIVSQILLPSSLTSNPSSPASTKYTRGIWKCADGYTLKPNGKCFFDKAQHTCSSASAVSGAVAGGFDSVVNKKLACCLNGIAGMGQTGSTSTRFDCIENANQTYADFNALWASSDPADTGGQMNAFILTNTAKKPVTGFYTLNGVRCGEYSEFTNDSIQPGKVNPAVITARMDQIAGGPDGFQPDGSAISKPSGTGFSTMVSKLGGHAKAPSTAAERRRCPILVRAALVAGCPENPQVPNAGVKTVEDKSSSPALRRCAIASSLQVKVRVEQVWQIAGQPKMVPVDTLIDAKSASQVSVSRIIQNKYGNQCPDGTKRQGDACVY